MKVEKARIEDAEEIQKIVNYYAKKELLLQRSLSEIYEDLRDFWVARKKNKLVGAGALSIHWKNFAEIRSLAVSPRYTRKGIGSAIVKKCLQEAKKLNVKKVFTLTKKPEFFGKLGFEIVDKNVLPTKVWADCYRCPKFLDCDEVAMLYEIR